MYQASESISVDLILATKIGDNRGVDSTGNDNDGTQKNTRGWLSITKTF
jgi:hypothetical protein